jgi:ribosomal protein S4
MENETLKTKIETLELQLTNSREETSVYKRQVEQLQAYLKEVSFIKEQFESTRVAQNQLSILQELQQQNINLKISCHQLETNTAVLRS